MLGTVLDFISVRSAMLEEFDTPNGKASDNHVPLNDDRQLIIDISDALCEKSTLKFTIHTRTKLPVFQKPEFSVVRFHEDFIWLHDRIEENELYAGYIIPPPPPRPDFDASRDRLVKLGESESILSKQEFQKRKQELEAEYLALFKKTVAMHEIFLQRIADHALFCNDKYFQVFLEYQDELLAKGKNKKEKVSSFFKSVAKSADEVYLGSSMGKETDEYFLRQKEFLSRYVVYVKLAANHADHTSVAQRDTAIAFSDVSDALKLAADEDTARALKTFLRVLCDGMDRVSKVEMRVAADVDLKLTDTLRYYHNDSEAAKNLLYRRSRSWQNFENACKMASKAQHKANKDPEQLRSTEENRQQLHERFEKLSETARSELLEFRDRRVKHFQRNLVDAAELHMRHAKTQIKLLEDMVEALKA